jgi:hypothetical protein
MDFRNLGSSGFPGCPRPVDFLAFLACAGCVCPHHFSLPSGANEGGGGGGGSGSEDASSVRALLATSKVWYLLFLLWILKALLDQVRSRRGGSSILAIAMRGPSVHGQPILDGLFTPFGFILEKCNDLESGTFLL